MHGPLPSSTWDWCPLCGLTVRCTSRRLALAGLASLAKTTPCVYFGGGCKEENASPLYEHFVWCSIFPVLKSHKRQHGTRRGPWRLARELAGSRGFGYLAAAETAGGRRSYAEDFPQTAVSVAIAERRDRLGDSAIQIRSPARRRQRLCFRAYALTTSRSPGDGLDPNRWTNRRD